MKKNTTTKAEQTKVIFKQEGESVVAFFPEIAGANHFYTCLCYQHVGQHSTADVGYGANLRPAKNYDALKKELESIGYNVQVARRFTQAASAKRREMCE